MSRDLDLKDIRKLFGVDPIDKVHDLMKKIGHTLCTRGNYTGPIKWTIRCYPNQPLYLTLYELGDPHYQKELKYIYDGEEPTVLSGEIPIKLPKVDNE